MLPKSSHLIELATPVRSDNDVVIGVLSAHLNWDWLLRQHQRLESAVVRPQRSAILIAGRDGLGELLSTPRETIDVTRITQLSACAVGLLGMASGDLAGSKGVLGWLRLVDGCRTAAGFGLGDLDSYSVGGPSPLA